MKPYFTSVVVASALGLGTVAQAAVVNTPFTFSDLTVDPASGVWSNGGTDNIGFSRLNIGATATADTALATVSDFTPGTNFSVGGSFAITTNDVGTSTSTQPKMSVFGVTLFGDTSDTSSGIFATLTLTESRANYDGGQRLHLGTNRGSASTNYVGDFPVNGDATTGETFLAGSNTNLVGTVTYDFVVNVSYDSATQADISFEVSDGTNTKTLVANNIDISSYAARNVFGVYTGVRVRSLEGTFSDLTVSQVPEPASLSLLGLAAVGVLRRRR